MTDWVWFNTWKKIPRALGCIIWACMYHCLSIDTCAQNCQKWLTRYVQCPLIKHQMVYIGTYWLCVTLSMSDIFPISISLESQDPECYIYLRHKHYWILNARHSGKYKSEIPIQMKAHSLGSMSQQLQILHCIRNAYWTLKLAHPVVTGLTSRNVIGWKTRKSMFLTDIKHAQKEKNSKSKIYVKIHISTV